MGFWAALWTGQCLCVESSIHWICVLILAEPAHREVFHGGVFTVVGKLFDYGVSWAAISTGDEEVIMSSVSRQSEFLEAFWAYGYVWWDD